MIKIKRGFADIILEKNKKVIIEVKDYKNKEISISQIKQLNNYLGYSNSNLGFLICHKKPKIFSANVEGKDFERMLLGDFSPRG